MGGIESSAVFEEKVIRSACMKGAGDIQAGIGAEDHTAWIDEVEVGALNGAVDTSIYRGAAPARYTPDDIANGPRSAEGCTLTGIDIEFAEAVEQVAPHLPPQTASDGVAGSCKRPLGAKGSIHGYSASLVEIRKASMQKSARSDTLGRTRQTN